MSQKTCLYDLHVELGGRIVDFAGFELPVQYESILAEHKHTRQFCSLFDTCHMGQFMIYGPGAADSLGAALTQDAAALKIGRGKYGFLLTDRGTVIDDTILFRLDEEEFFLVVNAATAKDDYAALRERLPMTVGLDYLSSYGKLDVQGPQSYHVLKPFVTGDMDSLGYFGCMRAEINGQECLLGRTGYTGEWGYEIFMSAEKLPELMRAMLAVPGVKPAGLGARDSLRLEMGYALYGHELSLDITPAEASLDFFYNLRRSFVGAEALLTQFRKGLTRKLVPLISDGRRQFHPGDAVLDGQGQPIGQISSGVFSPSLGCALGLGFVSPEAALPDTQLTVKTERADIPVTVTGLPFYTEGTCRLKEPPAPIEF